MEFVPSTSFGRIVDRYGGNSGGRRLSCVEQFRVMAFVQLTWRESLRDIEVTLGANANKLYALGLRNTVRRSTLAIANESRDWCIWADVGALLIKRARKLHTLFDLRGALPCDQSVQLNGFYATQHYPETLRRIRFKDPETEKTLILLTSNFVLPPLTIAAL